MLAGLLMLAAGLGLFAVAWQRWRAGQAAAGSNTLPHHHAGRAGNPFATHVIVLLFMALGGWLVVYGAILLLGAAVPPR